MAFCSWCVQTNRLSSNPFKRIGKANEKADPRRALTEDELKRLVAASQRRPLLDAMTIRRGKRKGQPLVMLRDETRKRLELLGWERSLIYKTLVLTGLRRGELASLTVGQLDFDGPVAYASLNAADEKVRRGAQIPLRADLATDLKQWLHHKLQSLQDTDRDNSEPFSRQLPTNMPLFTVPTQMVLILNRDLKLAGIPKHDDRGRTVDVHAFRHSFGTHLSKGGVAPRTAQAAMRHCSIDLTMNVYTDPKLLDVVGALDALPSLPLKNEQGVTRQKATGTEGSGALAPMLAPTPDNSGTSEAYTGKRDALSAGEQYPPQGVVTVGNGKTRQALSNADNAHKKWAVQDLNLWPPACKAGALAN